MWHWRGRRPLGKIAAGSSQLVELPEQLGWPAARAPRSTKFSWEGGLLEIACSQTPRARCVRTCLNTRAGGPRDAQRFCTHMVGWLRGTLCSLLLRRMWLLWAPCGSRRAKWERNPPWRVRLSALFFFFFFDKFGFVRGLDLLRFVWLWTEKYQELVKSKSWALQYNLSLW